VTAECIVAGHVCVDLKPHWTRPEIPPPGELWDIGRMQISVGGCVGNTGRALANLGMRVRAHAAVGDDVLGVIVRDSLASIPGVDARLHIDGGAGTSYSIVVDSPGRDRSFIHHTGANARYTAREVVFGGELAIHVGYPQLLDAMLRDDAKSLIELVVWARKNGLTTSIDFATPKPGTVSARSMRSLLSELLPLVDIFSPSVDDLIVAMPELADPTGDRLAAAAGALCSYGAALVLLKAGAHGAGAATADARRLSNCGNAIRHVAEAADLRTWVPAMARDVVHTTGAGDVASATFLYELLRGSGVSAAAHASQVAAARCVEGVEVSIPLTHPGG
jgi:sugar/nucleoside kinase (ribokinase family)